MDMVYKYKVAFSMRDKIGTCPNIQVEIDVMDKSPFFIRSYHVKEDKNFIDKEMKQDIQNYTKKGTQRYTFACGNKRNTGRNT